MNRQGHLNNTQHGFRSGRSCLSALLDVFDDLMHMLSSGTTDMISIGLPPLARVMGVGRQQHDISRLFKGL